VTGSLVKPVSYPFNNYENFCAGKSIKKIFVGMRNELALIYKRLYLSLDNTFPFIFLQ
jgi:hypothetical protein